LPIRGSELVQRLQTMVQVSTRERHRSINEQFATEVIEDLRPFGLQDQASEAFDFFRKWRRDGVSMKKMEEAYVSNEIPLEPRKEGDRDGRDPWLRIPLYKLIEIFENRRSGFDFYVSEFNNIKSKSTHVTAVFRPFKERYVVEWSRHFDSYPLGQVERMIADLNSEVIGDKVELHIWASSVYELFKLAAVYNPAHEEKISRLGSEKSEKRLPQGMISSTSERIYGQQWRLWLRENEDEISQFLIHAQVESADLDQDVFALKTMEAPLTPEVSKPEQLDELSIQVSILEAPELTSTQTWLDSDYTHSELKDWLTLLGRAWGLERELVQITLKFKSNSKSSELTLRPSEITQAHVTISDVIGHRQ